MERQVIDLTTLRAALTRLDEARKQIEGLWYVPKKLWMEERDALAAVEVAARALLASPAPEPDREEAHRVALHTFLRGECIVYPGSKKACDPQMCYCLSRWEDMTLAEMIADLPNVATVNLSSAPAGAGHGTMWEPKNVTLTPPEGAGQAEPHQHICIAPHRHHIDCRCACGATLKTALSAWAEPRPEGGQ